MTIREQIRFDFYEDERKGDFVNCEQTCLHYEEGNYCPDCVLAEYYEGEYADQIQQSASDFEKTLHRIFGG